MANREGAEVRMLTRVAERLFDLYSKGVRFSLNGDSQLVVDCPDSYRLGKSERAFVSTQADRIRFLLPFWRVKLFHSLMTPSDVDFLQDCNVNLELPEDSELRSPVVLPTFETAEQSDRSSD